MLTPFELHELLRLVLPCLPPVLGHDGLAGRAVILHDAHLEDVDETDGRAGVVIDVDALGAPRLIWLVALRLRRKVRDLEEIERDTIVARHGENRSSISLKRRQARLL